MTINDIKFGYNNCTLVKMKRWWIGCMIQNSVTAVKSALWIGKYIYYILVST